MSNYTLQAIQVSDSDVFRLSQELEGSRCAVFGETGSLVIDLSDGCDDGTRETFDAVLGLYGVYSTDADYFHIYA